MADYSGDLRATLGTDFPVETLNQIKTTGEQLPSPSLITNAVLPEDLSCEGGERVGGITDEATNGVGVQAEEERDEEMVSVPEGLERLLPNAVVGGGIHEQHAKQHDVTCNTTGLGVVNLDCGYWSDLSLLHVVEAVLS